MFDRPVTFVDIETTGGSASNSRVLEVAAIRYENGMVVQEYSTLLNPDTYIPRWITNLTGITSGDVVDAPRFSEIAADLHDILDGAVFVAHNVNFDYSFIKSEFERLGGTFRATRLCTVRLSRFLYPQDRGHSLEKLIARHGLPFDKRHRALDDTRAILRFAEIAHQTHGSEKFAAAVAHQLGHQSLPVNLPAHVIADVPHAAGVYIFKGANDQVLYVGKSIDMRLRVAQHFQDLSAKEQTLARDTTSIQTIVTGDELLALILESYLVKKLQPFYNRQLRKISQYTMAIRHDEAGYPMLAYQAGTPDELEDIGDIYGLYESKPKAKKWNEIITKTYDLCPKLMGLERGKGACFNVALGKCRGACVGKEPAEHYVSRFEVALKNKRLMSWPYSGSIRLPVGLDGALIIDNWQVVGTENIAVPSFDELVAESGFDYDIYRILRTVLTRTGLGAAGTT